MRWRLRNKPFAETERGDVRGYRGEKIQRQCKFDAVNNNSVALARTISQAGVEGLRAVSHGTRRVCQPLQLLSCLPKKRNAHNLSCKNILYLAIQKTVLALLSDVAVAPELSARRACPACRWRYGGRCIQTRYDLLRLFQGYLLSTMLRNNSPCLPLSATLYAFSSRLS